MAEFSPPAEVKTMGGLAAAPDVWVSKQWYACIVYLYLYILDDVQIYKFRFKHASDKFWLPG